jgi:hypothetical protein
MGKDDCRPGFHGEFLWRESEIIDVHLHPPPEQEMTKWR